jgi:hypothetical protein
MNGRATCLRQSRPVSHWNTRLALLGWLFVALSSSPCFAINDVGGPLITFSNNGAWSWFEDERAIVDTSAGAGGKIIVSSVANASGSGGAARAGDVDVVSYDLATAALTPFTLHDGLESDDHDSAALLTLPDGRYLAAYSEHSTDRIVRWRVSTAPGSTSAWGTESTYTESGGTTYSNLEYLSASGDLFDFHRVAGSVGGYDPNYLKWNISTQPGFSFGGRLLTGPEGNSGSSDRPYVRYTSNGVDRIDFITTDAHPRDLISNSVYHGYIRYEGSGNYGVYKSDGVRLGDLSQATTSPYKASDFTPLLNGNTISPANNLLMTRGWTTDVQLDAQGNPYAVFTARVNDSAADHRFFYGRYTDAGWSVHELARAGGSLYSAENDYTGLVALDPSNPNRLFMSAKIDPRTNVTMARYEIFEGSTTNGGTTWAWNPITYNSTTDNIRPVVPKWDTQHTALLWLRGNYTTYTDYNLAVVGLTQISPLTTGPGSGPAQSLAVSGTWTNAVGFGDGPITGANTSSPVVGDGTANSATQEMIHSAFQQITLARSGDKIVFTGSVTLAGTVNSPLSSGNPKTQFRFGLFEGDSAGPDDNGWVGYSMSNRHGNNSGPNGTLGRKPVGNTSAYLSTTGQNTLGTQAGDNTSASLFNDDTYYMNMTIQRSGNDLVISATLDGLNGFTQSISATDTTALTQGTYSFNRLGFLLGNNLAADQATFSNLLITYVPAAFPGDFNNDGRVDAADYVVWRKQSLPADKYQEWRANFGSSSAIGTSLAGMQFDSVPEPTTSIFLTIATTMLCTLQKRRARRIG